MPESQWKCKFKSYNLELIFTLKSSKMSFFRIDLATGMFQTDTMDNASWSIEI